MLPFTLLLSLPLLALASRNPSISPPPSHQLKLVARQDPSGVPAGCIDFYNLVDSCTSALPEEELESLLSEDEPPANSCFCSQSFFTSGFTCGSALSTTSTPSGMDPALFISQLDQFEQTCLTAGFPLLTTETDSGLIPIPTVTRSLDDGVDDTSSTSEPVFSIQTQMASVSQPWNTIVTETTSEGSVGGSGTATRWSSASAGRSSSATRSASASATSSVGAGGSTGDAGRRVGGAGLGLLGVVLGGAGFVLLV